MAKRPKVLCVVGARPNFIKITALIKQFAKSGALDFKLVHTGQHYDERMSGQFFKELGIPMPDVNLGIGSASQAVQTARVMEAFEPVVANEAPAAVVVVGDVNSTIACALTAVKLGVPVAHVEAGLRSFDRSMPEEINRVLTDAISERLYTTEASAKENLLKEGVAAEKIVFVGNVMIDTLLEHRAAAESSKILERFGATPRGYAVLTLHRPANVDSPRVLGELLDAVRALADECPVVFPVHPRTLQQIRAAGLEQGLDEEGPLRPGRVRTCEPLGYLEFIKLVSQSRLVLTDSGGLQEETTILGVPCLTLRENTERPVTVTQGTNEIVGVSGPCVLRAAMRRLGEEANGDGAQPELWDGHAAERITADLCELLG